jgi:predicted DNA-binding transcriptional regulator YafY
MRRADRLFQLIQLLRSRRSATAAQLAIELEVSTRTVYRDVQDLLDGGVPIEGEAVGYRMRKGFELPPLTFTVDELSALVFGARLVQSWADRELGAAVRSAMSKVEAVLPEPLQESMLKTALFGPPMLRGSRAPANLAGLRKALMNEQWADLSYVGGDGRRSERTIVPLGLYFWGPSWLCAAYCLLRKDYRTFRVDRIERLTASTPDGRARDLPSAVSLDDYIATMEQRGAS